MSQLREMRELARQNKVAYVPAQQGYILATVSRLLYTLATGRQTSKADAIEWAASDFRIQPHTCALPTPRTGPTFGDHMSA